MKTDEFNSQVALSEKWITEVAVITTYVNHQISSYGYKHHVERYFNTYISNDAFKQAARNIGLKAIQMQGVKYNLHYNLKLPKSIYHEGFLINEKQYPRYEYAEKRLKEMSTNRTKIELK